VGEGALKIGRRRQQSRRFFVMVGVVEMEIFWLLALLVLMADGCRFRAIKSDGRWLNLN
jgi:hypothetical protein